ncbi:MAG: EipA family protein [Gammaproteobacteria bacterium]|jgi:hypothetical protein|nr:EipA family protein [Gammaproteobacteria bacterium]
MIRFTRSLTVVLMAIVLSMVTSSVLAAKEEPKPVGYIDFSSKEVALIFGLSWGKGELRMDGQRIPIKGRVLSLGVQATIAKSDLTGNVYNAKTPEDVAGSYNATGASAAFVKGAGEAILKNEKGTVLKVWSTTKGFDASAAIGGLTIELAD